MWRDAARVKLFDAAKLVRFQPLRVSVYVTDCLILRFFQTQNFLVRSDCDLELQTTKIKAPLLPHKAPLRAHISLAHLSTSGHGSSGVEKFL
jgi:hypothetical protein